MGYSNSSGKTNIKGEERALAKAVLCYHSHFFSFSFNIIIKNEENFEMEKDIANTISNEAYTEGTNYERRNHS